MPLYIPLISIFISFLLIYKKTKKKKIINRYIFFIISFLLLVMTELLVRYSGISITNFYIYLLTPFISVPIVYFILLNNFKKEQMNNKINSYLMQSYTKVLLNFLFVGFV